MRASAISLLILLAAVRAHAETESLPSTEILHVIASAQEVYVFPYTSSEHPKLDEKQLRPLDAPARDTLKRLLSDPHNWYDGLLTVVEPLGVRNVGVLFRSRGDQLVLFLNDITISGSFRGRSYYGALENKPIEQLEKWKERYAGLELQAK
jgi:hypothetical protein